MTIRRLSSRTHRLDQKLIDLAGFLAAKARGREIRRGAEAIAGRMRNQRLQ
jgi:hypothetical protein